MTRTRTAQVQLSLAAAVAALFAFGLAAAPPALAACSWSQVPSPSPAAGGLNMLLGVDATSPSDAWAVGLARRVGKSDAPLAEHWDGAAWRVVPTPGEGPGSLLTAVDALTSTDAWAAGDQYGTALERVLIEHWDGSAWRKVPAPNPGRGVVDLLGISAIAPDDVWAVGRYATARSGLQPLIEHWDGSAWQVAKSRRFSTGAWFDAVNATGPDDVWAVGMRSDPSGATHTLTEHWEGHRWRVVGSPDQDPAANDLLGVASRRPNDAWAVGLSSPIQGFGSHTLVEHWTGAAWSLVPGPAAPDGVVFSGLTDAVVRPGGRVVVAGETQAPDEGTLIASWDGASWTVEPGAIPGALLSMAAVPGSSQLWAVGRTPFATAIQTIIERRC